MGARAVFKLFSRPNESELLFKQTWSSFKMQWSPHNFYEDLKMHKFSAEVHHVDAQNCTNFYRTKIEKDSWQINS